jgi:hypothetical protein
MSWHQPDLFFFLCLLASLTAFLSPSIMSPGSASRRTSKPVKPQRRIDPRAMPEPVELPTMAEDFSGDRRKPVDLKNVKPLDGLQREQPPRHDIPAPNPVRSGPGSEERLRDLQRRFRAVSDPS